MKQFTAAIALAAALAWVGSAAAIDINWTSGTGEWDLGTWDNGTTTGPAIDIFGRDSGWDAGNTGAPEDPNAIIGAGDNIVYNGGIIGDFRWRNRDDNIPDAGRITIQEGGKLELQSSAAEDGEWIQFDANELTVTGAGSELNRTAIDSAVNGGAFTFGSWRSFDGMNININVLDHAKFTGVGQLWFGAYNDSEIINVTMTIGEGAAVSYTGGLAGGVSLDDTAGEGNEGDIDLIYNFDPDTSALQENNYAFNFTGDGGSLTVGENGIRVQRQVDATFDPVSGDLTDQTWESELPTYEELWDQGLLQADGLSGLDGKTFADYFTVTGALGDAAYTITRMTPVGVAGDYDGDGDVDGADFVIWQRGESPGGATADDLAAWEANFGATGAAAAASAVPEPASLALIALAGLALAGRRRR